MPIVFCGSRAFLSEETECFFQLDRVQAQLRGDPVEARLDESQPVERNGQAILDDVQRALRAGAARIRGGDPAEEVALASVRFADLLLLEADEPLELVLPVAVIGARRSRNNRRQGDREQRDDEPAVPAYHPIISPKRNLLLEQ